jgi:hypothetical protein
MSPVTPSEFRMSRSMENFSRPTRLSVSAIDLSPTSLSSTKLSAMGLTHQGNVAVKPLPHLPGEQVVHAVSTRDDSALPLRTAPLPSPPKPAMEVVQEESDEVKDNPEPCIYQAPSINPESLAVPTTRQRKRRSQSSGELHFDLSILGRSPRASIMMGSDSSPKSKNRISIGVKPAGIEDWEDAIDYSWEHATELDDAAMDDPASHFSTAKDNYLVVEQRHLDEASSSSSTPLMMQMPPRSDPETSGSSLMHSKDPVSPLLGLGIDSLQPRVSVSLTLAENLPEQRGRVSDTSLQSVDIYQSRMARSPNSMMSKSSSQESIIASIFGTQRSSNSSTSLSDFAHLASGSFAGSVEYLKLDFPDYASTPGTEKHFREGSQDTIREDLPPQDKVQEQPLAEADIVAPLSSFTPSATIKHDRGSSAPQIPNIPVRKSSIPDPVDASRIQQTGRRRANTATSRPPRRNARVSYSLFPTST